MYARVDGWDIVGKTGTTNSDRDCWFCGMSPYGVMATWTGFDQPDTISDTTRSAKFFSKVMGKYLEGKEQKDYKLSENCIKAQYNPVTGLIVSTSDLSGKYVGYYTEDNMPSYGSAYYGDSYNNYSDNSSNYNDYNNYYGDSSSYSNNNGGYNNNGGGDGASSSHSGENSGGGGQHSSAESGGQHSSADGGGGDESNPAAPDE